MPLQKQNSSVTPIEYGQSPCFVSAAGHTLSGDAFQQKVHRMVNSTGKIPWSVGAFVFWQKAPRSGLVALVFTSSLFEIPCLIHKSCCPKRKQLRFKRLVGDQDEFWWKPDRRRRLGSQVCRGKQFLCYLVWITGISKLRGMLFFGGKKTNIGKKEDDWRWF